MVDKVFPHPTEHSRPKEHIETDMQTVQLQGRRQKLWEGFEVRHLQD